MLFSSTKARGMTWEQFAPDIEDLSATNGRKIEAQTYTSANFFAEIINEKKLQLVSWRTSLKAPNAIEGISFMSMNKLGVIWLLGLCAGPDQGVHGPLGTPFGPGPLV